MMGTFRHRAAGKAASPDIQPQAWINTIPAWRPRRIMSRPACAVEAHIAAERQDARRRVHRLRFERATMIEQCQHDRKASALLEPS